MGKSYLGQTLAESPSSDRVCEGCVVVTSRSTWVGDGRPEKHHTRMYSHRLRWREGVWEHETARKGENNRLYRWCLEETEPRYIALAVSGKKHSLPYARLSAGDAVTVSLDGQLVSVDTGLLFDLVLTTHRLQDLGQSLKGIREFDPYVQTQAQFTTCRMYLSILQLYKDSLILDLALMLAKNRPQGGDSENAQEEPDPDSDPESDSE
jgi:hypothetical protein